MDEQIGLGSDLAKIEGDEIVIRVPIAAIPHAAKIAFDEANYDIDDDTNETRMVVTDAAAFALGMIDALNQESEDGSTPIHYLLDRAVVYAAEQGTEGIESTDTASADDAKGAG
jgi:hypothetical protein